MLALVGTVMSRSPSGNVLLRDGDGVLGTHTLVGRSDTVLGTHMQAVAQFRTHGLRALSAYRVIPGRRGFSRSSSGC